MAGVGEELERRVLGFGIAEKGPGGSEFVDFLDYCPNLESLSTDKSGSSWKKAFEKYFRKRARTRTVLTPHLPIYGGTPPVLTLGPNLDGSFWQLVGGYALEKVVECVDLFAW